jgi:hypothetical protein
MVETKLNADQMEGGNDRCKAKRQSLGESPDSVLTDLPVWPCKSFLPSLVVLIIPDFISPNSSHLSSRLLAAVVVVELMLAL